MCFKLIALKHSLGTYTWSCYLSHRKQDSQEINFEDSSTDARGYRTSGLIAAEKGRSAERVHEVQDQESLALKLGAQRKDLQKPPNGQKSRLIHMLSSLSMVIIYQVC